MISQQTIAEFLNNLASHGATPGGGSVAAMNGAMGAALVSMACNLTIGRKNYAAVEAEVKLILEKSEALRARLTQLISQDIAAFEAVMAAYRGPRYTAADEQAREESIQAALKGATIIPLEVAHACAEVITLWHMISLKGNTNALGDAKAGALSALAGLKAAALTVELNLTAIHDETFMADKKAELRQILLNQTHLLAEFGDPIENGG